MLKKTLKVLLYILSIGIGLYFVSMLYTGFRLYQILRRPSPTIKIEPEVSKKISPKEFQGPFSRENSIPKPHVERALSDPESSKAQTQLQKPEKFSLEDSYQLITLSQEILESHPEFHPCDSICKDSEFKKNHDNLSFEVSQKYYKENGKSSLDDPGFNLGILMFNNLGLIIPPELLRLLAKNKETENKWLMTQIISQFSVLTLRMPFIIDKAKINFKAVSNFSKTHRQCVKGELNLDMADLRCRQDFEHFMSTTEVE